MSESWEGAFGWAVAAALGLSVGSFANVLVHRLPREGLSVSKPARSFCPTCGNQLRWFENIPLFAWLIQRGRCRSCQSTIAWRYPAVELLIGLLYVALWMVMPPVDAATSVRLVVALYLATLCVVVSAIDLEFMIIPDVVTLPGIALGLLVSLAFPAVHAEHIGFDPETARRSSVLLSGAGLVLGGGSLWLFGQLGNLMLRRRIQEAGIEDAMGLGDVKWMAFAGTLIGPLQVGDAILAGCFLGALVGLIWKIGSRLVGGPPPAGIPFGPFLSVGILLQLFVPGGAWELLQLVTPGRI